MIEIRSKFVIVNLNPSLDFGSDQNQRSKLAGLESELSTIRFITPNRICLVSSTKSSTQNKVPDAGKGGGHTGAKPLMLCNEY